MLSWNPSVCRYRAKFRKAARGVPSAIRLPYPMVDNNTLQAGEYGGWLGAKYDPIVIRTPAGKPFGGVSRSLGSQVLNLGAVDVQRVAERRKLRESLERPVSDQSEFEGFDHFRELANDILLSSAVKDAYNLQQEDAKML